MSNATTTASTTLTSTLHETDLPSIFDVSKNGQSLMLKPEAPTMVSFVGTVNEYDGHDQIRDVFVLREKNVSPEKANNKYETDDGQPLFTVLVVDECECCYYQLKLDDLVRIPIYFNGVVRDSFVATDAIEHLTHEQALEFAKLKAAEFIATRTEDTTEHEIARVA